MASALRAVLPDDRVLDTPEDLIVHGYDGTWRARRSTSSSFGRLRPNKLGEDISVPRSAIPAMVRAVQGIADRYDLLVPLFGHIGDGNLHPNILCDLRNSDEMSRVGQAAGDIFTTAIGLGGALSGEHGIGRLKREFLANGIDPAARSLMRRMKEQIDPSDLLNPGKVGGFRRGCAGEMVEPLARGPLPSGTVNVPNGDIPNLAF